MLKELGRSIKRHVLRKQMKLWISYDQKIRNIREERKRADLALASCKNDVALCKQANDNPAVTFLAMLVCTEALIKSKLCYIKHWILYLRAIADIEYLNTHMLQMRLADTLMTI